MCKRIFLIGYRGVGKTTIGNVLANRCGWEFVDSDILIEERFGRVIDIVETNGWEKFRHYEKRVLSEIVDYEKTVIATGGGAVLHGEIWEKLPEDSKVVWLAAQKEILYNRIAADRSSVMRRPSLTDCDSFKEIETVLFMREPLYRSFADIEIDTGMFSVHEAAEEIYKKIFPDGTVDALSVY